MVYILHYLPLHKSGKHLMLLCLSRVLSIQSMANVPANARDVKHVLLESAQAQCRVCNISKKCCIDNFSTRQIKNFKNSRPVVCYDCSMKEKQDNNKLPKKVLLGNVSGTLLTTKYNACDNHSSSTTTKLTPGAENNAITTLNNNRVYVSNPSVLPISGFRYYKNFLNNDDVEKIMNILDSNPWRTAVRRRQQFYGEIYYHTIHDVAEIQPKFDANNNTKESSKKASNIDLDMSPFQFLIDKFYTDFFVKKHEECKYCNNEIFGKDKSTFPTQILVNEYIDNVGISSHFEDEEAFGPVIATISLLNPIYMTLEKPIEHNNSCDKYLGQTKVLLEKNSLFIMSDDCRFEWRHAITRHRKVPTVVSENDHNNETKFSLIQRDHNYRRVSLTIRHLLPGRKQVS